MSEPAYKLLDKQVPVDESELTHLRGQSMAINQSQAIIEFSLSGVIETANDNFLKTVGYSLAEIKGKHHRIFCDPAFAQSGEYRLFWEKLTRGENQIGEYQRLGNGGKDIWLKASYCPVLDDAGKPFKVVKFAFDVTAEKQLSISLEGQITAIHKAQAVIEFNLDGMVQTANDNFLRTLGYSLDEIKGRHHRMFCDPAYTESRDYKVFWEKLRQGEFDTGEYKRIGKNGKEVWIQASYNPIFDLRGRPYKVIKFATDISAQKLKDAQLAALSLAQAVVEFTPDGMILDANANFTQAMGYSLSDIRSKHHSLFCDAELVNSSKYRQFWSDLASGKFQAGQFKRLASGKREIWLQASYNPVFDLNGKVFKVVKYATDITKQKKDQAELLSTLTETAGQLASAAAELNATASQMTGNATKTASEAKAAAVSSEEVARGVRTVATNTEEMSAAIKEIARNANDASGATSATMKQAEATNSSIVKLGESSQEIGNVVKVISSIAQQTNLLALNATIEAARAGDAGRGFAVVANEVKELAKQTAKATEEITGKIGAIQKDTSNAVDAISGITASIQKLNAIAGSIAAAVEEQQATTNEVARVVQESSKGVENITANVKTVSLASNETQVGSSQLLDAGKSLAELANKLSQIVQRIQL